MKMPPHLHKFNWCIVVADDHGPEWAPTMQLGEKLSPVQYSRLGGSSTLLQRAMRRAARMAPPSQVMITALDEYREYWEPSVWCVRSENRFVGENRTTSLLTGAAALLSIAQLSPSHVVTILPARCHVAQEWILRAALERALSVLPGVREGVVTLGMSDFSEGIDEDYLAVAPARIGAGLVVLGFARRPTSWTARLLVQQGAMIASGIMIGYAGAFAAHISKHWPGLTQTLAKLRAAAAAAGSECEVPMDLQRGVPRPTMKSLRWNPPMFPQRAIPVMGSGWSGLRTQRAVERVTNYFSIANTFVNQPLQNPHLVAPRVDQKT
jgi:mannose-1-phosphate guanylyltransferase